MCASVFLSSVVNFIYSKQLVLLYGVLLIPLPSRFSTFWRLRVKSKWNLILLALPPYFNSFNLVPTWVMVHLHTYPLSLTSEIMWKELSKCLDDVFVQMFGRKITTSTLSSCTCSFEGQATLNEYVRCGLYSKK